MNLWCHYFAFALHHRPVLKYLWQKLLQLFSLHFMKMSGRGDESAASSVDLSRMDFQAICYEYCWRKSFQEWFQSLKYCFGDIPLSKATVSRWFWQCVSTARMLEDNDCCGCMVMTITPEVVPRIESLVKKDPKITIHWNRGYEHFIRKSHSHFSWPTWRKTLLCLLGSP